MLPNFLIVGAMKAGTTSMWHGLRQHPDVFMPAEKEINFFGTSSKNSDRDVEWYERQFANHSGESAVGEASPRYMIFDDVPKRIYDLNPDMDLIFILRDPVDRACSHYWHMVNQGVETLSFKEAIYQEDKRIQRSEQNFRAFSYTTRGHYAAQISNFTEYFDRDQMKIIIFEEFLNDKSETYRDTFKFLDINASVQSIEDKHKNRGSDIRTLYINKIINNDMITRIGKAVLPSQVGSVVQNTLYAVNQKSGDYPTMEPALREELYEEFADDIDRLESTLDKEIPWESSN